MADAPFRHANVPLSGLLSVLDTRRSFPCGKALLLANTERTRVLNTLLYVLRSQHTHSQLSDCL